MYRKNLMYALLLVILMVSFSVGTGYGQTLESIEVKDLQGNTLYTDKFLGEYVIYDLWASWCPPCRVAMSDFQRNLDVIHEKVQLVAISIDDRISDVEDFVEEHDISFTVLHDAQKNVIQWQVQALPTMILVAPDGSILLFKEGYGSFEQFWNEVTTSVMEHMGEPDRAYDDMQVQEESRKLKEIEVKDLQGETILPSEIGDGQFVLVDVWATWCPSCVISMEEIQSNLDSFKEEDIAIVAISVDEDLHPVQTFIEEKSIEFLVLHDPMGAVVEWGVQFLPTLFFLAPTGEVLFEVEGRVVFDDLWDRIISFKESY